MYFFVAIPLEIAFNNMLLFGMNGTCTVSCIIFLILDFFMKMNTVFYKFGEPVTDRALIVSRYMSDGFFIDSLSILSLIAAWLNYLTV